jgi:NAD(P)H-flavin reductase
MMILTAGKPASLQRAANLYKGKGVISEVFITTMKHIRLNHLCPLILFICHTHKRSCSCVDHPIFPFQYLLQLPVAKAGANFQAAIIVG